ncbi:ribosomal protein L40E [Microlunatus capsulatus]|uniref:Ribosomal protein L40E n=1 Tax=Microlunatus capsulatus TaxID=99117 RepID=A0ABS4Z3Y9_9ACTN|nr:FHA domain-containing protein [Microlunatus capsulatus]MBP2415772.1 ribosomal protein L40E [Microlunatus capsulatus]
MSAVCPAGHQTVSQDYCDVCGLPVGGAPAPAGTGPAWVRDAPTGSRVPVSSSAPGAAQACPHCNAPNPEDALFCEACGYDFTTGAAPRPLTPPAAALGEVPPAPGADQADAGRPAAPPPGAPPVAAAPEAGADVAPTAAPAHLPDTAGGGSEFAWVVEIWVDPSWYQAQESPDPLPSAGLPVVRPLRGRSLLVGRVSKSRNIHPDVDCGTDSGVSRRQCQLTTDGSRWWVEDLDSANGTFVGPASGALPEDPVPVGARQELRPDDRVYVGAWTRLVLRPATDEELVSLG